MKELDEVKATLTSLTNWNNLNAYEMTKHCCLELTKCGKQLPSWMIIRDIIGKGSANDINRGKKDFLIEHGNALRKMNGLAQGVPEALTPHIMGLWAAAKSLAHEEFDKTSSELEEKLQNAERTLSSVEEEKKQAVSSIQTLEEQVFSLKETVSTLQTQLYMERAALEKAEQRLESNQQEQNKQREALTTALAISQKELNGAISRLEEIEQQTLLEITKTRMEAQNKIADIEAKAKNENNEHIMKLEEMNNQLHTILTQHACMTEENNAIRLRVQRAESQVDYLVWENSTLIEKLQALSAPNQTLRHKLATIKKRRQN